MKFSVNLWAYKSKPKYCVYASVAQHWNGLLCKRITRTTNTPSHTHTLLKCIQNKLCKIFEASTTLFQQRLKSTYKIHQLPGAGLSQQQKLDPAPLVLVCRNSGNILLNASSTHVACVTQKEKRTCKKERNEVKYLRICTKLSWLNGLSSVITRKAAWETFTAARPIWRAA